MRWTYATGGHHRDSRVHGAARAQHCERVRALPSGAGRRAQARALSVQRGLTCTMTAAAAKPATSIGCRPGRGSPPRWHERHPPKR